MKRIFGGSTNSDAGNRHVRTESNLYARIIRQARPYWLQLVGVLLLSMLASPISLLVPLPLKIAVDSAIANHPLPPFLAALLPGSAVILHRDLVARGCSSDRDQFALSTAGLFHFVYGDLYG
jgi:ABC-type multidrug transport system fused ATPase/permease subunit